jgi:hypothetical protein
MTVRRSGLPPPESGNGGTGAESLAVAGPEPIPTFAKDLRSWQALKDCMRLHVSAVALTASVNEGILLS